jgi:hypothetical protein
MSLETREALWYLAALVAAGLVLVLAGAGSEEVSRTLAALLVAAMLAGIVFRSPRRER